MITAEDIKHMTQSELEDLVKTGKAELDRRHEANVEKAWTKFFEAADALLKLGQQIKVDWDDSYEDEGSFVITGRIRSKLYSLSPFLTF